MWSLSRPAGCILPGTAIAREGHSPNLSSHNSLFSLYCFSLFYPFIIAVNDRERSAWLTVVTVSLGSSEVNTFPDAAGVAGATVVAGAAGGWHGGSPANRIMHRSILHFHNPTPIRRIHNMIGVCHLPRDYF